MRIATDEYDASELNQDNGFSFSNDRDVSKNDPLSFLGEHLSPNRPPDLGPMTVSLGDLKVNKTDAEALKN